MKGTIGDCGFKFDKNGSVTDKTPKQLFTGAPKKVIIQNCYCCKIHGEVI